MTRKTRHMEARMGQRGITRDLVDLALNYGDIEQDKRVLNQKSLKKLLEELRQLERTVIRAIDKGGIVVVEVEGNLITTYRH